MMKTNFTFFSKLTRLTMAVLVFVLAQSTSYGQCSLGCNSMIQVSLDNDDCEALVNPDMLLTDSTTCPGGNFIVELRFNGVLLPQSPTITHEFVGKTIEGKVIDLNSSNSCWGWIKVEDKLAPVIDCTPPGDMYCHEAATFTPEVEENCGSYTLHILDSIVTVNNCSGNLPDNVLKHVVKVYQAIDNSGNKSVPCTLSFNVLKLASLDIIVPPKSFLYPTSNLLCDANFEKDGRGLGAPHPNVTGYPKLGTLDLKPDDVLPCNLLVDYQDNVIKELGCVKKIMRTWTILEWSCANTPPRLITQMIEIADTNKPTIEGVKDLTVSTTPHHCDAVVNVPPAIVDDACTEVTVTISGGTPLIVGNGGITSLPVGMHILTYTASDKCGNSQTATITVTVEDLTPPVAVCDQNTTVSVTSNGEAWVPAKVFDDGSYDECGLAKMLVRKMPDDTDCECEISQFDDFISLGEYEGHYYYLSKHKIEARLANKHGIAIGGYLNVAQTTAERNWINNAVKNVNDTLGYLTKTPYIKFIDIKNGGAIKNVYDENERYNYVIEIEERCGWASYVKFCCADIGDDQMVAFRVVDKACNYNDCMVNADIQDKLPPSIVCPPHLTIDCDDFYMTGDLVNDFGPYTVYDNCESPDVNDRITFNNLNQCNVGRLERTITATDAGGRVAECIQHIQVLGKKYNYNLIDWPSDVTIDSCEDPDNNIFSPDSLGYPVFNDDQCNLVGADYDDYVYRFNNPNGEACFKIIRRWRVIDWCEIGRPFTEIEHDQVIKVHDTTDPVITSSCEPKSTCTYDAQCQDGFIELTATGTDVCTAVLDYFWKIDLNNDGSFEEGQYYKQYPLSGHGSGNSLDASGKYPVGSHRIQYTFADKCGNIVTCEQLFDIVNCKAPTPYCLNGLAVDLMPVDEDNDGEIDGGMVQLWASDFDAGSFHTCNGYNVYVSFSPDIHDTGRIFTCADVGRADVMIYASVITPMGDTLRSFCNTFVDVQDNMNACDDDDDDGNRVSIFGDLMTYDSKELNNATILLDGLEDKVVTSDAAGHYSFGMMPMGGAYTVVPSKDDDVMNGVSTLDLVMMQRHILNVEQFDSPYKHIAADINKDNKVSASDLVELRKLILGVTDKFTNNTSWRFVDGAFVFPPNVNPLDNNFDETYTIDQLAADMDIDFKSVKIGDVNASAKANLRDNASEPRSGALEITANDADFGAQSAVSVPFSLVEKSEVSGMQFTIVFDASKLIFEGVKGMDLQVSEDNFGFTQIEEGVLTFSWNKDHAVTAENLFELSFVSREEGQLAKALTINSSVTKAEAYDAALQVKNVEFRTLEAERAVVLYQNVPNPFTDNTAISFNLPVENTATLTVMDVTGRVLHTITNKYNKGLNTITLNKTLHQLSGVMYYQLTVNNETLTKKMVVIE